MIINAEQIRAARALLDWSTADLAKQSGLTVNGINKIERGHVQPHRDSLANIQSIFEAAGLEFLPNSGLRKKDRIVQTYEGADANILLWDDIFNTLKGAGGEVLIANVDEAGAMAAASQQILEDHLERLTAANITERLLLRQGDTTLIAPVHYYHEIPSEYFSAYPFYIYGPKLALVSRHPSPKAIIINDERFSQSVKQLFNFAWDRTQQPPIHKKN